MPTPTTQAAPMLMLSRSAAPAPSNARSPMRTAPLTLQLMDVAARLLEGLKLALASSAYRTGLARLGFELIDETPAQFAAVLQSDRQRFVELARRFGRGAPK